MLAAAMVSSCISVPTLEEKLNSCEAKGISRDTCYKVEMDRQRDLLNRIYKEPKAEVKKEK